MINRLLARFRNGQTSWSLADQLVSRGFNLGFLSLVAHALGLNGFGFFALLWIAKPLSDAFQISLVLAPMESLMAQDRKINLEQYFTVLVIHQAVLSIATVAIFALVTGILVWLDQAISLTVILLLLLAILSNQLHEFVLKFFFSQLRVFNAFSLNAIKGIIQFTLALLISVFSDLTLLGVFGVLVISTTLPAMVSLKATPRLHYDRATLQSVTKRHLPFSGWLLGSVLLTYSSTHFYLPLVGVLFGLEAVGGLRAIITLTSLVAIFPDAIARLIFPKSALRFSQFGWQGLVSYLVKVGTVNSASILCGGILLMLFSQFLLELLFGAEFLQFTFLVKWYLLVLLLRYNEIPIRSVFRTLEKTKTMFPLDVAKFIMIYSSILLLDQLGLGLSSAPQSIALGQLTFVVLSLSTIIVTTGSKPGIAAAKDCRIPREE